MTARNEYFSDQHVVVTGGGSGIGEAVARTLAAAGVRLTIMGRNLSKLEKVAQDLGATAITVDISDSDSVRVGFDNAVEQNGPVTMLINNAGSAKTAALSKMSDEIWHSMLNVNLTGTFYCTRAVVGAMQSSGFGRIVNIASTASLAGYAYVSAYCAAKHGVLGMTRALALETARKGVTVNAVCPGYTDTELVAGSLDTIVQQTGRDREAALAELVKVNPQKRLIQPVEVADTVLWLCGPNAGSITGQAIAVAGGEVM
jgi:NAD(P)-dependent dehydrogenase (short-subunit alcohol dehydrogenase family)